MKNRCFTNYAPPGIAEAYMQFHGVDGVHVLRVTSYECSVFYVGWEDLDYPVDREEFLIERNSGIGRDCDPHILNTPSPGFIASLTIIIWPGLVI